MTLPPRKLRIGSDTSLRRVLPNVTGDQFIGIEFNPTARTIDDTFRLGLLRTLQLSLHVPIDVLPDSTSYGLGRPHGPSSLFPSVTKYSYQHIGLHTGLWVVGFH